LIPNVHDYEQWKLKLVGVFSKNREEWVLLEYANFLYGNTMIPLYDTLGPESIPFVLNQSEIDTIFCSAPSILTLLKVGDLAKVKNVVTFDALDEDVLQKLKDRGLTVYKWQDVLDAGADEDIPFAEVKPTDIFTFSYTSGTTGNPKGVMISH
jgi:long-chain acyl-CoA synthetase